MKHLMMSVGAVIGLVVGLFPGWLVAWFVAGLHYRLFRLLTCWE